MTTNQTISPFASVHLGERVVKVWGTPQEPYFKAVEISYALGLTRISAHYKNVNASEICKIRPVGSPQKANFLTEKGAYQFISMIMPSQSNRLTKGIKKEVKLALAPDAENTDEADLFIEQVEVPTDKTVHTAEPINNTKVENIVLSNELTSIYELIDNMRHSSRDVARIFHKVYGDNADMEENSRYLEIQTHINDAITCACTEIANYINERVLTA